MFIYLFECNKKTKILTLLLIPVSFFLLVTSYKNAFYNSQLNNNNYLAESTKIIRKLTNENETLLIYGESWDSSFPYYAQRKAIMNWQNLPLSNKKIQKTIKKSGKISALVFSSGDPSTKEEFIQQQLEYLNFNNTSVYQDARIKIYLPN